MYKSSTTRPLRLRYNLLTLTIFGEENTLFIIIKQVYFEKLTVADLFEQFPSFYGIRSFSTMFTKLSHLSLSCARSSSPCFLSYLLKIHFNIVLLFASRSSKWRVLLRVFHHFFSHIRATCAAYLIVLGLITQIISGEEYRSWSFLLNSPIHFVVFSLCLTTRLSNTLRFFLTQYVRDQVLHPYKTIRKIIIVYTLIFIFLNSEREDKRSCYRF